MRMRMRTTRRRRRRRMGRMGRMVRIGKMRKTTRMKVTRTWDLKGTQTQMTFEHLQHVWSEFRLITNGSQWELLHLLMFKKVHQGMATLYPPSVRHVLLSIIVENSLLEV
jgi:hypothetical protein